MDKKKLWIIGSIVAAMIPIIVVLCLFAFVWKNDEKPPVEELKVTATANGGTIRPWDTTAASVEIQSDGTSVGDAIYTFNSKYGYSLQYNNKYIVDLSGRRHDFYTYNDSNTVFVAVKEMEMEEKIANIQTKEEWDALMGSVLGESKEFKRTPLNNMEALIGHYMIDYGNGVQSDVIYAMLIGNEYIYNYIYSATSNAPQSEATQIGSILYTIQEI